VASQRARKLHSGDEPTVEKDNDKNTVIALREIADSTISVENMKENLIQEYQTVTINDEEDENLELDSLSTEEDNQDSSKEVENEINDLIKSEDSEIEEQYEISDISEDVSVSEEVPISNDNEDNQAESDL
jgi:DNA-directed RNA polymerase subunit omega